jgi:ubiquinone/menaquinone biosynthesis C-methylase UbiE
VLVERTNQLLPFSTATSILDNGCGPGPITSHIIAAHGHEIPQTCEFLTADFSEGMIAQVETVKKAATGPNAEVWQRVETAVLDATDLSAVADGTKSHVLAGWVYFMTPSPQKCLTESLRVLSPGGILTCTSWQGSQWLDLMGTFSTVRPDINLPQLLPKAWSDVDLLREELESAGFRDVRSERVKVTMRVENHERLVEFLITKLPHSVELTKRMSEEEVRRWKEAAVEKCREMCPVVPGELHGVSLMATGRK